MTLGGLAIAVGLLVDAAIIMVENILHRLAGAATPAERRARAAAAAVEVARPIAFATLIVIVVFLPLFGMSGIEGRMYQPLAAAVIAAMAAALLLAMTVVPIAAGLVLRPARDGGDHDVALLRWIKARYAPILDWCLRHPRIVAVGDAAGRRAGARPCRCWSAATSCPSSTRARSCCRRCCPARRRSTKSIA